MLYVAQQQLQRKHKPTTAQSHLCKPTCRPPCRPAVCGPRALLFCGLPSQLWVHPPHLLPRPGPPGCAGADAGGIRGQRGTLLWRVLSRAAVHWQQHMFALLPLLRLVRSDTVYSPHSVPAPNKLPNRTSLSRAPRYNATTICNLAGCLAAAAGASLAVLLPALQAHRRHAGSTQACRAALAEVCKRCLLLRQQPLFIRQVRVVAISKNRQSESGPEGDLRLGRVLHAAPQFCRAALGTVLHLACYPTSPPTHWHGCADG